MRNRAARGDPMVAAFTVARQEEPLQMQAQMGVAARMETPDGKAIPRAQPRFQSRKICNKCSLAAGSTWFSVSVPARRIVVRICSR